ncbi:hypothetical protein D3C77_635190 [compost metagenome]
MICRTKISDMISIMALGALPRMKSATINTKADRNAIELIVPISLEFNVPLLLGLAGEAPSIKAKAINARNR